MKSIILIFIIISINCQLQKLECYQDNNCDYLNQCINNKCKHKNFFPFTTYELIGGLMIMIGSALSNAGGIGGGGLLIPILILELKFSATEAIPISKLMIFTGALTSFLISLKNKHPFRDVSALDINIGGLLIPSLLFGTMVGVTLNKTMPPSLILISLTFVLIVNTYKTFMKGLSIYKKENEALIKVKLCDNEESEKLTGMDYKSIKVENKISEEMLSPKLITEYENDKIIFNREKFNLIFLSYALMIIISLVKGSSHTKSIINIQSCSPTYWIIYLLYFPICIFITHKFGKIILEEYNYRLSIGYPYHSTDIKWNTGIMIKYPFLAFCGGIMAGLLGIGGGLILGPLLLELGIHPVISTATSNFLVLFTSSSTSLQFIFHGMMNFKYGLVCTFFSTIGSYIGTILIQRLVEKTKRSSVLIFSLALVLSISTIFIPSHTFLQIYHKMNQGLNIWIFESPC